MNNKFFLFKFQKKIYFIYSIITLIIFTITFIIFAIKSSHEVQKSNIEYLQQLNDQINKNINIIISTVDRTAFLYTVDSKVSNILSKVHRQNDEEYINDARVMENFIDYSLKLNQYIWAISFVGLNGNVYSNINYNITDENKIIELSKEADKLNGKKLITPVYKTTIMQKDIDFFTINRSIFNVYNREKIGAINIDVDFKKIRESFYNSEDSKKNQFLIIQNQKLIFNTDNEKKSFFNNDDIRNLTDMLNSYNKDTFFYTKIRGTSYLCVAIKNENTGWWIVHYVPKNMLRYYTVGSIKFYLGTIFLLLIISVVWGYILTLEPLKPFNRIFNAMKSVGEGDLREIAGDIDNDEIGMIIKSYNHMVKSIKESINREYVTRINQQNMEIKMLQAQINPHFLYNTLNLMSSIAELKDVDEICDISRSLSQIFRYSIKEGTIVDINNELNILNCYIRIQQMRFPNRYNFNIDIDKSLINKKIIKMIIQPIVENSVCHGIDPKGQNGNIDIIIKKEDNLMLIEIADDGIGINSLKLIKIKNKLSEEMDNFINKSKNDNIGLLNVNHRIKSYYGKEYGIEIISSENNGTRIKIKMPIVD